MEYVYAVGLGDLVLDGTAPVTGVDGGTVRTVGGGRGLTALVSTVPADRFAEEHLPRQLEDLERLEAIARAHHAVVDAAFATATVLPMRLATVYHDRARVAAMLDEQHPYFEELLRTLDGHVELGLKVYAEPKAAAPAGGPEPADASPGRAYLQRRRAERRRAQDTYGAARESAERAAEVASALASARAVHRPQQGEWSGGRGENVSNEAYLVPRQDVERFRAELGAVASDVPGVTIEVTGPWAPYSFAGGVSS
ncbi:gas vesicle synthesis protein [Streptomyces seoulensis]|uniref:Gas vesicle synthesis protein n=2 Tax=Streptomyces seoulensis TaxID=73044 RepID=A0A4V1A063_STRSO|nr:gas vesicle synthesis protein [Streptomyces seoulensis]